MPVKIYTFIHHLMQSKCSRATIYKHRSHKAELHKHPYRRKRGNQKRAYLLRGRVRVLNEQYRDLINKSPRRIRGDFAAGDGDEWLPIGSKY